MLRLRESSEARPRCAVPTVVTLIGTGASEESILKILAGGGPQANDDGDDEEEEDLIHNNGDKERPPHDARNGRSLDSICGTSLGIITCPAACELLTSQPLSS